MKTRNFSTMWAIPLAVAVLCLLTATTTAFELPFAASWASSGHADPCSEAFTHWDQDDPPEVPTTCARCHSTPGHLDFLGADGTEAGTVDFPAPVGTTLSCVACHNDATLLMDSVTFPSGVEVTGLGAEARCIQCHQGRESTVSVDTRIADANVPDDDTVSSALSFRNIHYLAAGATQYGADAMGGYQYAGKSYDTKFAHVEEMDTCIDCHDQHSLELRIDLCGQCHAGVAAEEDLGNIRFVGSASDYNGNGNITEGISDEIAGLQVILYDAILAYANSMAAPIVYDSHSYPYWFNDTNGNGQLDEGEPRYAAWTARLVRATYNFQFSHKDPGAYAHNAKYVIQLLYDSIEDLDQALVATLTRNDAGHFAGSEEPWRHWDEDGEVSERCSRCHSAKGLPFLLETGLTKPQPLSNGMLCKTCHDAVPGFSRRQVGPVEFPSGLTIDIPQHNTNLCITCHQGRESTTSVNEAIAGLDLDTVNGSLRFINVHYLPAGATFYGAHVKGTYEYAGKSYNGRFKHVEEANTCTECHDPHSRQMNVELCKRCHPMFKGPEDFHQIRRGAPDYDGDWDIAEGIKGEIDTYQKLLYNAIQNYAANVVGTPIAYSSSYPYFFIDTNGNGLAGEDEISRSNRYSTFTPRLVQATYNYQYVKKDPGGFAHNGRYLIQVLYDSIESLAAQVPIDMSRLIRPEARFKAEFCGDPTHPYPPGDINQDCRISFLDIAAVGAGWMEDNNP